MRVRRCAARSFHSVLFLFCFAFDLCWFRKCVVRHDGRESQAMAVCWIRTIVTAETVAVLCPRQSLRSSSSSSSFI